MDNKKVEELEFRVVGDMGGAFHFTTPSILNVHKVMDAFRNGGGISYSDIGEEIPEAIGD